MVPSEAGGHCIDTVTCALGRSSFTDLKPPSTLSAGFCGVVTPQCDFLSFLALGTGVERLMSLSSRVS